MKLKEMEIFLGLQHFPPSKMSTTKDSEDF
jgi:hypothetical protein